MCREGPRNKETQNYPSIGQLNTCEVRKEWITETVAILLKFVNVHTIFFSFGMHCQEDERENF